MLFNSYEFLFAFLPVVLVGFYVFGPLLPNDGKKIWLIGASLFFYGWWNYRYLSLIIISILVNYLIGYLIGASKGSSRRFGLILGIVLNLGLIAVFKYFDFFIESASFFFGLDMALLGLILPLAISFFTFQQIAYLVDRFRDRENRTSIRFADYVLFVLFFPQLIAGPIVHHGQVVPQFKSSSFGMFRYSNLSVGLSIFIIGLFKKVCLADTFGAWATPVFSKADSGVSISGIEAWIGAVSYSFQLYFDFSGYSDMAIGLARMFGIVLPANFFSPYKSTSIIEFWRRWHMTLSQFLRDYLYIPLGGNKKGTARRYANLMATMLLGGLWHGAGWNFVFWGGLHGVYLCVNHVWRQRGRGLLPSSGSSALLSFWYGGLTFLAVLFAWVFFRAETFSGALIVLESMFSLFTFDQASLEYVAQDFRAFLKWGAWAVVGGGIIWLLPNTIQLFWKENAVLDEVPPHHGLRWRPGPSWLLSILIMFVLSLQAMSNVSEFLYFQF